MSSLRQRTLLVHCLRPAPTDLVASNVLITGGESIVGSPFSGLRPLPRRRRTPLLTSWLFFGAACACERARRASRQDGISRPYTLQARQRRVGGRRGFRSTSPRRSPASILCSPRSTSRSRSNAARISIARRRRNLPAGDALAAADQLSRQGLRIFLTLILDRLRQLAPSWGGASEADIGVVLAELVAYVGDQLSYRQDAVTTEAYLGTARSRISLRRHARLVDYRISEGCNSRALVCVSVTSRLLARSRARRAFIRPRRACPRRSLRRRRGGPRRSTPASSRSSRCRTRICSPNTIRSVSIPGAIEIAACRRARPRRRWPAPIQTCRSATS